MGCQLKGPDQTISPDSPDTSDPAERPVSADRADSPDDAETKAQALERNAAATGSKAVPSASEMVGELEAQAIDPIGEAQMDDTITCLARTIYWEARGEGAVGMEAVSGVVMNRLGHDDFPDTVCEVVMQGQERGTCQFSWWCDGRSDDATDDVSYTMAKEIARESLNQRAPDRSEGGLYFHHRGVTPDWAAQFIRTAEVGPILFYKPHGGDAR